MSHLDEDLFNLNCSFNCISPDTNKYYLSEDSNSMFPPTFDNKKRL